jgi:5'-nucleotidase
VLGSATLASGAAAVDLTAKSLPIGTHRLTLSYSGDARHDASTGAVTVTVTKATPALSAEVTPQRVVAKDTKPKVVVTVAAEGVLSTGSVLVAVDGNTYWASLTNGTAVVELKKFKQPGTYDAAVSYFGDTYTTAGTIVVSIEVEGR